MKLSYIEQRAYKLLEEMKFVRIPISVEEIATSLGLKIFYEPFEGNLSGLLYRDESATVIGVNSAHPETRQRFTIAHEIGHFVLHQESDIHVDRGFKVNFRNSKSSEATDWREIEANTFAAALLMPAQIIKECFTDRVSEGFDISDSEAVSGLADEFNVSQQALMIRLVRLGLLNEVLA